MTGGLRKGEIPSERYADYLRTGYRPNLIFNLVDNSFFQFGWSVISLAVVLPAFCLKLGASNTAISFLQAIGMLCWNLPQLFISFLAERMERKKPFVVFFAMFQRIPWLLTGLAALVLLPDHPALVLAIFFVNYTIASVAGGITSPAWAEMIAKAIPVRVRGIYMGAGLMTGSLLGVAGGLIVKFVLNEDRFPYPTNFALLFLIAGCLFMVSQFFLSLNREPILPLPPAHDSLKEHLRDVPRILKKDKNFLWFIIARSLFHAHIMATAFYMVYAMRHFGLGASMAGNFIVTMTLTTILASTLFGRLGDRFGHKMNLVISRISHLGACLLAFFVTSPGQMYAVFILLAMGASSYSVSMNNILFEFAPEGKRPTYFGMAGIFSGFAILLFTSLSGYLTGLTSLGIKLNFLLSAVILVISAVILAFYVREPRTVKRHAVAKAAPEKAFA